jgi:hypothetical protein
VRLKTRLRTYSACIFQNTPSKDLFPPADKVFFLDMISVTGDILMTNLLLRFYRSFYIFCRS